jgi:cytochrome c556
MRDRKDIFSPASVVVLLLSGFLAVSVPAFAEESYTKEISLMMQTVSAFDYCSGLIENAESVDAMSAALKSTADSLEKVIPDMLALTDAHPEWADNPPAEVRKSMDLFMAASQRFFGHALKRAYKYANDYPDNEAMQRAFGRVNKLLYFARSSKS